MDMDSLTKRQYINFNDAFLIILEFNEQKQEKLDFKNTLKACKTSPLWILGRLLPHI